MRAMVDRHYLQSLGYSVASISLADPKCRPKITSTEVIFNTSYSDCGTRRQVGVIWESSGHGNLKIFGKLSWIAKGVVGHRNAKHRKGACVSEG